MSPRALFYLARYLVLLVREIWLASVAVAKLALGPIGRLRSGFVALEMEAASDLEITALANSITLTPGTITVHVDPAHRVLVLHAIDLGQDPEDVRRATKEVLEANILKWTRAGGGPRR